MNVMPPVGARVMRRYGRKEYAEYGEIGVVTAHNEDGITFSMTLDAHQPYARWMWGAKAKPTDHAGLVHETLTIAEVDLLEEVYRENARRFHSVAEAWEAAANGVNAEPAEEMK